MLIEDITQMWQDACHIWKYHIIKCYKMLVIFKLNTMVIPPIELYSDTN